MVCVSISGIKRWGANSFSFSLRGNYKTPFSFSANIFLFHQIRGEAFLLAFLRNEWKALLAKMREIMNIKSQRVSSTRSGHVGKKVCKCKTIHSMIVRTVSNCPSAKVYIYTYIREWSFTIPCTETCHVRRGYRRRVIAQPIAQVTVNRVTITK